MTPILSSTKLTEIFITCDDFCKKISSYCLANNYEVETITETALMSESEMMTIVIYFHHSGFRCFKHYYEFVVQQALKSYFPHTYSYSRFVHLMQKLNFSLFAFLMACRLAAPSEGNYVDATKLVVCHNKRILKHKVFKGLAKRGKSSTGWFFGFKLHAIINQYGQLVIFNFTAGNVADNNPILLEKLTERIEGFLYGDAGYISSIAQKLKQRGLELITKLRENMKPIELTPQQKHFLKFRGLIVSVFNLMKNHCQIQHTRHRSVNNFFINLWGGLIAYTFLDELPNIPLFIPKVTKNDNYKIVLI